MKKSKAKYVETIRIDSLDKKDIAFIRRISQPPVGVDGLYRPQPGAKWLDENESCVLA